MGLVLLAVAAAGAVSGAAPFSVDISALLNLTGGGSAVASVELRPGETVYAAAVRACHEQAEQPALAPHEQEACIIPLAKWLNKRSPTDGRWRVPGEEDVAKPWGIGDKRGDWLARLPRDSTRRMGAGIGAKPPQQPTGSGATAAESCQEDALRFGFGRQRSASACRFWKACCRAAVACCRAFAASSFRVSTARALPLP